MINHIQSLQSYKSGVSCTTVHLKTVISVTLSTTSKNAPLFIHDDYSYIIDRRTDKEILWKCEYSRKFKYRGRLHTDLNNILIITVGNHENHIGDPHSGLIRVYYDRLRQESLKNQTNPHNILNKQILASKMKCVCN